MLGRIARIEALEVVVELGIGQLDELGQRCPREIAVLVVDRLDPRPIHRQQFPTEQIQLAAQQHELPEHRAEGIAVVAAEVGDGLEVGLQVPQQPDHLDVAMGLGFEPPTGPDPVKVTVDVELQQITGGIVRAARRLRRDTGEPRRCKVKPVNKGVDEPHRVVGGDVIVDRLRQKQQLAAVISGDVRHTGFYRAASRPETRLRRLFTQSA